LSFIWLIVSHKMARFFFIDQAYLGYFLQWIFLMSTTVSLALYFYKDKILSYCNLNSE